MALGFLKKKKNSYEQLRSALGDVPLPSFSAAVLKTLEMIRNPNATARDIARPLSTDPELSVRILRLVNSAAFSPRRPITAVEQAVAMAGSSTVESLALAIGVSSAVPTSNVEGLDQARFWKAATRRAVMAKAFAQRLHPDSSDTCFTVGLLQDMAVPLLAQERDDYSPLLIEWHKGGEELQVLEEAEFGWTHPSVAGWLCQEWQLPQELAHLISNHHRPDQVLPAVALTALSQEREASGEYEAIVAMATEQYGMTADDVVELLAQAEAKSAGMAQLFI